MLSPYTVTIYTKQDNPYNVIPDAPIEIRERLANGTSGSLSTIYEDQEGLIPITQTGAKADSNGQFTFYAEAAQYNAVYESQTVPVDAGVTVGTLPSAMISNPSLPYVFDTVATMSLDSDLPIGKVMKTTVHNTSSNKGGAKYIKRAGTSPDSIKSPVMTGAFYAELVEDDLNPFQVGVIGDGVADDTVLLTYFDGLEFDHDIDLLGNNFVVTAQPSNNKYYNGSFIVAGKEYKQIYNTRTKPQGARSASFNLKKVWFDPRYRDDVPKGLENSVIWLGDSISHGAFQGNLYQDGMVNIVKRCIRAESGVGGYGYAPMLGWNTPIVTTEVHDVIFSAGNSWVGLESTSGGEDIMQGLAFQSSAANDSITFTVPTFQEIVRLWYVTDPSGGIFEYTINGGAAVQVDTSGTRDVSTSVATSMLDNGYGKCQIVVKVVSGTVTFAGIGYETGTKNNIQNFSQSGRRLEPATEQMIDYCCRGATLVLALGHNDYGDAALDPVYAANFNQRIDWIIEYCLKYNTTLFVADFCWWVDQDNPVRVALRRAAQEAQGTYIGLPDYLTRDDFVKVEYNPGFYQVDSSFLFSDTSHPKAEGARWAAQAIASDMGLSVTSKKEALDFHDYPFPLQLIEGQGLKNRFNTVGNISKISQSGQSVNISIRIIEDPASGGFDVGVYSICDALSASRQVVGKYGSSAPMERGCALYTNTNAIAQHFTVSQGLAVSMESITPWLNTVDTVISMNNI